MFKFSEKVLSLVALYEDDIPLVLEVSNKFVDMNIKRRESNTINLDDSYDLMYIEAIREVMDSHIDYEKRLELLDACNKLERFIIANS